MLQKTLNQIISFDSLIEIVCSLEFEQKRQLWEILDQEMEDTEEQREVLAAKTAYEQGDYLTLEEYTNQRNNK